MEYADKILTCSDCGLSFTFGAGEQEFFASKGFVNEPGRCPDCRAARKQNRFGNNGGYNRQRQMYPAVCASCGKDCQIPFEPREERPVYCSDCYSAVRR
jgi:CxxC-x17-CxxC domain-containing protein